MFSVKFERDHSTIKNIGKLIFIINNTQIVIYKELVKKKIKYKYTISVVLVNGR